MTRQWLAHPGLMCIKHISGEHAETHGFLAKMHQGHSLDGFYEGDLFFGAKYIQARHDLLALFLKGHSTPMAVEASLDKKYPLVMPDMDALRNSIGTLITRCAYCADKHKNVKFVA